MKRVAFARLDAESNTFVLLQEADTTVYEPQCLTHFVLDGFHYVAVSMYDDYDSVTPGNKAYNFEELYSKLEDFFNKPELLKKSGVDYISIKILYGLV